MLHSESSHTLFYVAYSTLLLLLLLLGFGPSFYFAAQFDSPQLSNQQVAHGLILSVWYLLILVQAILVARGWTDLHQILGRLGAFWVFIVLGSSTVMLYHFALDFSPGGSEGELIVKVSGLWANLHLLASFALFATLGLSYRKQRERHKRFMLLASISMMAAAMTRIGAFEFVSIHPGAFTFAGMFLLLCIPMIFDRLAYRKIHPIYLWGSVSYFATLIIFAVIIPLTAPGQALLLAFH